MTRDFNVIIERDGGGYYVATVPALKGCHTQARSLDKLMERVREAIALCLEVEGEGGGTAGEDRKMSRLLRISGKKLVAALAKAGFATVRTKGSHFYLRHPDGRA